MSRIRKTKQEAETVQIEDRQAGRRLDNFLLSRWGEVPRSRVYQMIRKGEVRVNGGRVSPHYRLQDGDRVRVPPVRLGPGADRKAIPPGASRDWRSWVLHEDEDLILLDKPAGLAVHGGTGVAYGLIDVLRQFHPAGDALQLAHRLDRGSSGCLLVAKNPSALRMLHDLLRTGRMMKQYLVLLQGHLQSRETLVDAPLDRNVRRSGQRHVSVAGHGKPAQTRFKTLRRLRGATLAMASIRSGRTHQIRVHAAYLGHPVAGDQRYGNKQFNRELRQLGLRRLFLHASSVRIPRRNGAELGMEAPMPQDLRQFLRVYENTV